MENWTVGQIIGTITLIAGAITALGVIFKKIGSALTRWVQIQLAPVNDKLLGISEQMTEMEKNRVMDFITQYLADVERGIATDDEERKRFWENYDLYTSPAIKGNSYIHEKVERLKREGKL